MINDNDNNSYKSIIKYLNTYDGFAIVVKALNAYVSSELGHEIYTTFESKCEICGKSHKNITKLVCYDCYNADKILANLEK